MLLLFGKKKPSLFSYLYLPNNQTNLSLMNGMSLFSIKVYQTVLCTQGITQLNSYQYEIISTDIAKLTS